MTAGNAANTATILSRLEEAGRTLLTLPDTGPSTRMRTSSFDVIPDLNQDACGPIDRRIRLPIPDAGRISRMDEAFGWIARIPSDRFVLRRIVGARALVSPLTDRHLYPWRRLAAALGADHKAVQRWHAQGISFIVASLNCGA